MEWCWSCLTLQAAISPAARAMDSLSADYLQMDFWWLLERKPIRLERLIVASIIVKHTMMN
jgi:hypothetical protein